MGAASRDKGRGGLAEQVGQVEKFDSLNGLSSSEEVATTASERHKTSSVSIPWETFAADDVAGNVICVDSVEPDERDVITNDAKKANAPVQCDPESVETHFGNREAQNLGVTSEARQFPRNEFVVVSREAGAAGIRGRADTVKRSRGDDISVGECVPVGREGGGKCSVESTMKASMMPEKISSGGNRGFVADSSDGSCFRGRLDKAPSKSTKGASGGYGGRDVDSCDRVGKVVVPDSRMKKNRGVTAKVVKKYVEHERDGCYQATEGSRTYWEERYRECHISGVDPQIFEWFIDDMEVISRWITLRVDATSSVLEICCGNSQLANALGKKFDKVVALDWSGAVVEEMRNAPHPENVQFFEADVRRMPREVVGDASFDAVVSKAGLDSMMGLDGGRGIDEAFAEIERALRPGNSLFVVSGFGQKMRDIFSALPESSLLRLKESFVKPGKGGNDVYFYRLVKIASVVSPPRRSPRARRRGMPPGGSTLEKGGGSVDDVNDSAKRSAAFVSNHRAEVEPKAVGRTGDLGGNSEGTLSDLAFGEVEPHQQHYQAQKILEKGDLKIRGMAKGRGRRSAKQRQSRKHGEEPLEQADDDVEPHEEKQIGLRRKEIKVENVDMDDNETRNVGTSLRMTQPSPLPPEISAEDSRVVVDPESGAVSSSEGASDEDDQLLEASSLFSGRWRSDGVLVIVADGLVRWYDGSVSVVDYVRDDGEDSWSCKIEIAARVYRGSLAVEGYKLTWSDGDVWTREDAPAERLDDGTECLAEMESYLQRWRKRCGFQAWELLSPSVKPALLLHLGLTAHLD
eukprot:TRINITY_DN60793_c0_g1_i1.p1 TRINITY_DN60793_c0_g1~~TRINITY_DN60793_c0_g1_i1.p1  ORF type:complete len:912 (-),score=138.76 TRINITY_DN60793_c0_g1_i1:49-2454(-)